MNFRSALPDKFHKGFTELSFAENHLSANMICEIILTTCKLLNDSRKTYYIFSSYYTLYPLPLLLILSSQHPAYCNIFFFRVAVNK